MENYDQQPGLKTAASKMSTSIGSMRHSSSLYKSFAVKSHFFLSPHWQYITWLVNKYNCYAQNVNSWDKKSPSHNALITQIQCDFHFNRGVNALINLQISNPLIYHGGVHKKTTPPLKEKQDIPMKILLLKDTSIDNNLQHCY